MIIQVKMATPGTMRVCAGPEPNKEGPVASTGTVSKLMRIVLHVAAVAERMVAARKTLSA